MHVGKQRRIRHIRAIVGRNIGWNNAETVDAPDQILNNNNNNNTTASSCTSRTISQSSSPASSSFPKAAHFIPPPSLSSSVSSSVSPSAWHAPSPLHASRSLQLVRHQQNNAATNTLVHHDLYANDASRPSSVPLADESSIQQHHQQATLLRRSESATFLNNMAVADSSLTKSAYKRKSKPPEVAHFATTNLNTSNTSKLQSVDSTLSATGDQLSNNNTTTPEAHLVDEDSLLLKERGLLDTYLTLYLPKVYNCGDNDGTDRMQEQTQQQQQHTTMVMEEQQLFYTSETIPNSTNPAFRTDMSLVDWYDGVQSMVVAKLWAKHSLPESASIARRTDPVHIHGGHSLSATIENHGDIGDGDALDDGSASTSYRLLIEWSVNLNELVFIGKSIYGTYSWPNNTLLFELDDGYYTAPDIATITLGQQKRTHHIDMRLDLDNDSIESAHSPRTKRSYTYHHIMKLNTLKNCLFDAQSSANEVQININDILEQDKNKFLLIRERAQKETRLKELKAAIEDHQACIDRDQKKVETLRKTLDNRKLELKKSQERFQNGKTDLENNDTQLERNIQMHNDTFTKLNERKKELIADLFSIYPIEQSFDDFTQFRIRGIYLPNSVYTGCDEEAVATALGYTGHLVSMLAFYLSIPLRYPINPMGSRASIYDPVSLINGSRNFPLYGKGVDRYRFEFGVFLLNKNIEQMMNSYGLIVMDLRHTLPNIHYFIQVVLTTSVTSGPTSLSVLSISSYAQGKDGPEITGSNGNIRRLSLSSRPSNTHHHHHHYQANHAAADDDRDNDHEPRPLTLQHSNAKQVIPIDQSKGLRPSPTVSTHSMSHSPKYGVSPANHSHPGVHLSSHVLAAPAVLDAITTSSCQKQNHLDS